MRRDELEPIPGDDPMTSLKNTDFGIGQNADGEIMAFPASELPERLAKQRSDAEAWAHAAEQMAAGFPPEDDDVGFLSDYAALAAVETGDGDDDEESAD